VIGIQPHAYARCRQVWCRNSPSNPGSPAGELVGIDGLEIIQRRAAAGDGGIHVFPPNRRVAIVAAQFVRAGDRAVRARVTGTIRNDFETTGSRDDKVSLGKVSSTAVVRPANIRCCASLHSDEPAPDLCESRRARSVFRERVRKATAPKSPPARVYGTQGRVRYWACAVRVSPFRRGIGRRRSQYRPTSSVQY